MAFRITLITIGSRGDVQPYIALGKGLSEAGFRVCLATHERFREFVTDQGLLFRPVAGDPQAILQQADGKAMVAGGRSLLRFLFNLRAIAKPYAAAVLEDSIRACADADIILYNVLALTGYHIGEQKRVPAIPVLLQPAGRTRAFPTITTPPWLKLGGSLNYLTHALTEQIFWQISRPFINPWREQVLDIPRLPFWGPYKRYYDARRPFLYGFSTHVVDKPADWYDEMAVTGYWVLPPEAPWQPDPALADFLSSGPPPVYLGFGSMTDRDPETITRIAVEALAAVGERGVLLTGWGGLKASELDRDIFVVGNVPHEWLFPRMKMIIHHGGAGTTAAGLRAGVPNLVVPFFADQPFWGERIYQLGVGPAPISRRKLNVTRLAEAIRVGCHDDGLRQRAARLGQALRAEDGVANAVALIEKLAGNMDKDGSLGQTGYAPDTNSSIATAR